MYQDDIAAHKLYAEGLVKARANRASFSTSHTLEEIVKRSILTNKEYFCRLAKMQPHVNPLDKISPSMKKKLIELESVIQIEDRVCEINEGSKQQQQEYVTRQCLMLQLLLNQKMTSFHFPLQPTSANSKDVLQLWHSLLIEKPPNLISIVIENREAQLNCNLGLFLVSMLPVFPSLEVLRMENFRCNDADLNTIAEHLPNLRVLEVKLLLKVTERGIKALRQLKMLEEFIFTKDYKELDDTDEMEFMNYLNYDHDSMLAPCYTLLPHLHEVAIKPMKFRQAMKLAGSSTDALHKIRQPHTLLLHQLALMSLHARVPLDVAFPELQVLYLHEPREGMQLLEAGRCPKLVELNMECHYSETLMDAARSGAGEQLQTLRVNAWNRETMQLDGLLDVCPNLSELCLKGISWESRGELRPETLSQLRILRLHRTRYYDNKFEPGLVVVQLLELAPNLCNFEIYLAMLEFKDLEQMAELVEQRACLQHLERLHVILDTFWVSNRFHQLVDQFIIKCSIYCEKLSEVAVGKAIPW